VTPAIVSIVDDDASVRVATARLVRVHGFETRVFASAEEFLDSPALDETSCLITDIRMPGMSGADLQGYLISHGRRFPVIFMTAFGDERSIAAIRAAGAAGLLTKPFDGQRLINCLNDAFKRTKLP
jgi:FixJ family two-component response regulator